MGSLGVRLAAIGDRLRVHAPKGKLPTDLRAQIAERKAEILAHLGEHSPAKHSIPPPIHPRATEAPAPLSFAQERLWFLEQLEPQSAVYNNCRAVHIGGNLNVSAIEAALNEIIRRHQTLRTAFRLVDGQAVQIVQPSGHLAIDTIDLRPLSEGDRDVETKRLIKADAERPFDLHGGSLLRCKLLRVGDAEHILILVTHHAASDAWSMGILTRELWTLYQAYSQGKSLPLDPLPVQYSDYAVWQRDWLQGEVLEAQLSYWKEQLKELPILNLPTDRSRKPRQSFSGARLGISLSAELTKAVNELSHGHGVTPFMTLLAAFQVLLYRYSGQEDFALGSPIANRRRPEIEGLIGFFVNTLVLRADLSGNPSFAEVLSRVKDTCIGANANQDLPFEKLVQEIQPERDQSRNPLFQVMFVLQNATQPFSGIPGLRIEPVEVEATRSPFDLSLFLRERAGRYIGFFEYGTDLFNRDRIERMVGHFQTLLEAAVSNPDQAVATLPILTEAERHQILVEWNDTTADYSKDKCIHQLFEEQIERTPDAVAVEFEDQQITYRELNRRANQLAHYLMDLGIGPEKLVGICIERSIEMVVGLLGILKAGGAYVPLDPSYPAERLRFMMEDAQVAVLLTQSKLLKRIEAEAENCDPPTSIPCDVIRTSHNSQTTVVFLDRDWPAIGRQKDENPNQAVAFGNLVYVIYTSGSTGRPKGVAMVHRSLQNLIGWQLKSFTTVGSATVLQLTSLSFDVSFQEIFSTWCSGGTLILIPETIRRDPVELLRTIKDQTINRVFLPYVLVRQLIHADDDASSYCTNLTEIITAGEQLAITSQTRRFFTKLRRCSLHNQYGPTETHVASSFSLGNAPKTWEHYPPIGRAISNTRLYILDVFLQPLPIGITGELYIGGPALARGYWNNPELTAERFIPDPFSNDTDARLYRTGDRARYRPDGNIEFLGRTDSQVKIRGHRIELGEIESVLLQHPAVKDTVIVSRERDSSSEKELVAYVVARDESGQSNSDLRQFLQGKIPDYMIPSWFLFLDAIPLTSNGKLDRNALPPPDGERPALDQGFVEPRTEIEELVLNVWREILKNENIGIDDNFFELGGHSLLAGQIVARLQDAFDRKVPLSALFDAPTIAQLSIKMGILLRAGHHPDLPPVVPTADDGPPPLSMNQEQLWYLDRVLPGTSFFNMPYVYQLSGTLNVEALQRALAKIIERHEALRTTFNDSSGHPVQIIQNTIDGSLSIIDLRSIPSHDVPRHATNVILKDRVEPFHLSVGPLIRTKLLRLTDRESLLLITLHHIIADYWSMQVFRRELIVFYEAFSVPMTSALAKPSIQFSDYARWERRALLTGLFNDHLMHWKVKLTPITEWQDYGFRHSATEAHFQFAHKSIEITEVRLRQLRVFANRENVTTFIVLLTALSVTLYITTGQQDIRIGTLVANRRREVESAIGHFVNTVILPVHVSPEFTLKHLLVHVKESTLLAQAYQQFPMEQLMRDLESTCGIDRRSVFKILVNYQKRDSDAVAVAGLTFASWDLPDAQSELQTLPTTFDFIFSLKETLTNLTVTVNLNIAVTCGSTAAEVINEFNRVLDILVSEPAISVARLPKLSTNT